VNVCSYNSPYSLNCHIGTMLVFRMLCRITQSSDVHRTKSDADTCTPGHTLCIQFSAEWAAIVVDLERQWWCGQTSAYAVWFELRRRALSVEAGHLPLLYCTILYYYVIQWILYHWSNISNPHSISHQHYWQVTNVTCGTALTNLEEWKKIFVGVFQSIPFLNQWRHQHRDVFLTAP